MVKNTRTLKVPGPRVVKIESGTLVGVSSAPKFLEMKTG